MVIVVWPQRLFESSSPLAAEHVELPQCLVEPSGCSPERMRTAESAGFQLAAWRISQDEQTQHWKNSSINIQVNKYTASSLVVDIQYLVLIKHMMVFSAKMLFVPHCFSCSSSVLDLSGPLSDSRSLWKLMARFSQCHGWYGWRQHSCCRLEMLFVSSL